MKKGFTLIEITLTVLILIIISIGIVSIFSHGFAISTETREISIATQAAQQQMELIRDMTFDDILALGTSFTFPSSTFPAPGFTHLTNPVGAVTVSSHGDSNIQKVTVTVSWTSPQGRSSSKSLVTLITREGIKKQ